MILRSVLVFAICLHVGLTANLQRQELSISECAAKVGECDESKGRPVCGTDEQTYPTRCHLLRVQCSGHQVSIRYRGPCKAACIEARDYALKHSTKIPIKFIPRCKKDGTYASIQCLSDSGCWCSDITGVPIDNTPVRTIGKPKCRESGKPYQRRSPSRNSSGNKKRACNQDDRATFNSNIIGVFQSEYLRMFFSKNRKPETFSPPDDEKVLNWKFAILDVNNNQMLDKNEYRELKKLVKMAVKPRRCGRAFGKFCDVDSDARLSRLEWNSCLSKDGINRHLEHRGQKHNNNTKHRKNHNLHSNTAYKHSSASASTTTTTTHIIQDNNHLNRQSQLNHINQPHNNNNHQHRLRPDSYENESNPAEDDEDDDNISHIQEYDDAPSYYEDNDEDHTGSNNSSTKIPSININILNPSGTNQKNTDNEADFTGCFADRKDALNQKEENIKDGKTVGHVPECTPDGRFQRVQCYDSICWCANEETGETLNGTDVKNRLPQCDTIYPVTRAMKGCPNDIKTVFLKDLKEFLKTKIIAGSNAGTNTTQWNSEDERIATLSFVILDKNKNKSWERKEWKMFRELVTNNKTLRRCGRKMPRYCDVNTDKKVTLSEWLNCLQTQRVEVNTQPDFKLSNHMSTNDTSSKPPKLNGKNPLTEYLT